MYFLDSDIFTLFLRGHSAVQKRVTSAFDLVYLSSITLEEIVGAQLNHIAVQRSRPTIGIASASNFFVELLDSLSDFSMIAYSDVADELYRGYPAAVKRIGAMDCRLAAHAAAEGFVVITRNTGDFSRISGCRFEDWSSFDGLPPH